MNCGLAIADCGLGGSGTLAMVCSDLVASAPCGRRWLLENADIAVVGAVA